MSNIKVKTVEETKKTEVKAVKKELLIYVGPTIPGNAISNTVFNNGLSDELSKVIKEVPAIGALVVPVSKLAETQKQLKTKDSAVEICYRRAEQYIKTKGE